MENSELKRAIDDIVPALEHFKNSHSDRVKALETRVRDMETGLARSDLLGHRGTETDLSPELRAAWSKFVRKGDATVFRDAATVGTDPDGGYLVPQQIRSTIEKLELDTSPLRQYAQMERADSSDFIIVVDKNGINSGWVGEATARPETNTSTLGEAKIPLNELYAAPKSTQKLLDDSAFDVERWLQEGISAEFGMKESAAFVSGSGVSKPRGFTTYPTAATADATRPWGTIEHVVTGAASTFLAPTASVSPADCLIDLMQRLRAPYRKDAVFVMNSATLAVVQKFKDAVNGRFIWSPSLIAGQPSQLLGYPVVEMADMPDIAANAYPIAFAQWKRAYTIVDHSVGLRVLRDPFTAKPWIVFYATKRVGGDVVNFQAIKLLKIST